MELGFPIGSREPALSCRPTTLTTRRTQHHNLGPVRKNLIIDERRHGYSAQANLSGDLRAGGQP